VGGLWNDFIAKHLSGSIELSKSRLHRLVHDQARLINKGEVASESLQEIPFDTLNDDFAWLLWSNSKLDRGCHLFLELELN